MVLPSMQKKKNTTSMYNLKKEIKKKICKPVNSGEI